MAGGNPSPVPAGRVSQDAPRAEVQIRASSIAVTLAASDIDLEADRVMFTRHALWVRGKTRNIMVPITVAVEPERFRAIHANGVLDVVVERARGATA